MKKILSIAAFFLVTISCYSQSLNGNWKQDLKNNLDKFIACTATGEKSACGSYIGESLKIVYNLDDFYLKKQGRYMIVNEISDFLTHSDQWTVLGQSYDQNVLNTANQHANEKKAVVAVYRTASGVGHVVVITPGDLTSSGSWGLKVPAAASFSPVDPTKSFTDKSLSFAFSKLMLKDITLYAKKY
jgi:hypothetical protein